MTYRARNIVIAVALAVVAGLLTLFYVTNYKKHVDSQQQTVPVLVAKSDIPVGTPGAEIIEKKLLAEREMARKAVVPGAVSTPDQIRRLVATAPVFAGEQVTARRFGPVQAQGIRAQLKGTTRAVQIAGDGNQLLAGTLRPGDRIDVVANLEYKVSDVVAGGAGSAGSAADVDRVATRIILRDIKVLKTSGGAGTSAKISRASNSSWVILAVTDGQAQKLFFVVQNGEWTLQLRPTLRAADSPESVETIETVLGDGLKLGQFRQLYAGRTPRD